MIIYLTKDEYEFMLNENFLTDNLKQNLKNIDSNYTLNISEDNADAICDECGEYLQRMNETYKTYA